MKSRRILSIIGLILAAVLLLGIGFAIGRNDEKKTVLVAPTESTAPRLIISAVHADSEYTSEKSSRQTTALPTWTSAASA